METKLALSSFVLLFLLLPASSSSSTLSAVAVVPLSNEGKALMSIKAAFSNVANVLLDWDAVRNDDYCSWRGVSCDNFSSSVVSLNLSNLNLGGEISPSIGELRNLQSLDLKGNRLTGQIPDEIGDCVTLETLDLSGNSLYGDIPFSISKLKQLQELFLKSNQLTGPIPSTLSQIPNLKTLDLAQNQLTGEIPRLIYWIEVLQYLILHSPLSDLCLAQSDTSEHPEPLKVASSSQFQSNIAECISSCASLPKPEDQMIDDVSGPSSNPICNE